MGSALLDDAATATREAMEALGAAVQPGQGQTDNRAPFSALALRQQAAERVAAHRRRRTGAEEADAAVPSAAPRNSRSAKIAAAVAQRYALTQSYHDFLAAEAERAVQQARAAAEVAALNAQAVAAARQDLLEAIELQNEATEDGVAPSPPAEPVPSSAPLLWAALEPGEHNAAEPMPSRRAFRPPQSRRKQRHRGDGTGSLGASEAGAATAGAPSASDAAPGRTAGITIRLYQDETGATRVTLDPRAAPAVSLSAAAHLCAGTQSEEEALLLDEEIAFRREPVFEEPAGPAEPLPANLIEFPRHLVAARKARPRLAEGPLCAEAENAPGNGQLRIFEVDAAQIAVTPETGIRAEDAQMAQWSSILLGSQPGDAPPSLRAASGEQASEPTAGQAASRSLPGIASLRRRTIASATDTAILGSAWAAFTAIFLWVAEHMALRGDSTLAGAARALASGGPIQSMLPFAACVFALLAAMYLTLFFTLSTATPGMRIARIALCTFSDENPTRAAIRRRLPALLLSVLPMGFGFLWAMLDEERLTWHDRICGIYQRSY